MESIASFAHYILEEIDPDYDSSESYIGKINYYSSSKTNDGLCKQVFMIVTLLYLIKKL